MRSSRQRDADAVGGEPGLQNAVHIPRVFSLAERVVVGTVEQNRGRSVDNDVAVVRTYRPVQRDQTDVRTNWTATECQLCSSHCAVLCIYIPFYMYRLLFSVILSRLASCNTRQK